MWISLWKSETSQGVDKLVDFLKVLQKMIPELCGRTIAPKGQLSSLIKGFKENTIEPPIPRRAEDQNWFVGGEGHNGYWFSGCYVWLERCTMKSK